MATGHIRKRGKNSFQICIELDKNEFGERQRIYDTVRGTQKEAKKVMQRMLGEIETGTYVKPAKITVKKYLTTWLKGKKPNISERTYESYEMIIRAHLIPELGRIDLSKLQPLTLEKYKTDKLESGLSNRTVQYHLSVLSQALKAAVKLQLIHRNPVDAIEMPRVPKKPAKFLTPDQALHLLEVARKYREYPVIYFALHTGMRLGEILGLQWESVDLENKQVHVRTQLQYVKGEGLKLLDILKTDSSHRTISISKPVADFLSGMEKISDYVFCIPESKRPESKRHKGKPFDPTNFDNRFAKIAEEAGLDITMHSLRHTHASILLASGEQLNVVQERLGHERASTTSDIYTHVLPNKQQKSADLFNSILEAVGRQKGDKTEGQEEQVKQNQHLKLVK